MEYLQPCQSKPRLAIIASFTLIAVFVMWLLLPKSQLDPISRDDVPYDDDVPAPFVSQVVAALHGETVSGTIMFTQASPTARVAISGEVKNLEPFSKYGFHIHTFGDLSDGCTSAGPHFNPLMNIHGAPGDTERHVGDLGNLETDSTGMATFRREERLFDNVISLNGPLSIVGRAVVIHAEADDLGRGGDDESLKTGNAGEPVACGIVGLANLRYPWK